MHRYRGVSRIRTWVAVLVAALLLAPTISSATGASEFTLRVDGLACPFCAYGVEKKLLRVPGVNGMDVLINEGKIVLDLGKGADLDVAALYNAVDKAGFTLRGLLIRDAVGTLSREEGGELLLTCLDPRAEFRVEIEEEDATWAVDPRIGPESVLVSGTVTSFDSRPIQLLASEIRPLRSSANGTQ